MATKNGICPYCQFNRLQNRIFPVNPEATTVFCPSCMRELEPKTAIDLYNGIINKMVEKADSSLFVTCDPVIAYQEYANVLEVEPNNSKALLGRILCLIYTSRVRKSYLVEANDLLERITHKGSEEVTIYVGFLKKINFALDEYDLALLNRLTHKKYFYDDECIKLYLKRLSEIIKFKKNILEQLQKIKKDYVGQNNEIFINLISHSINEKENYLKADKTTIQGFGYRYIKIVDEKVYIERKDEITPTKLAKHKAYTLNENDHRGKILINDKVFKDYTPIVRAKKVSVYFLIVLMLLAIGGGITSYFFFNNLTLFIIILSASVAAFIGALILFILYFVWKNILKKRKMRID